MLQRTIDSYTSKTDGVPGLVCSVVDASGDVIFESASGTRAVGSALPMSRDTVFWIASCTKLLTAIAAMQLVEQGRLSLDDGDQLETHLPELQTVKVLEEMPDGSTQLIEKKRKITLRMLLSHTAGFSYSFLSMKLKRWSEPIGIMEDANRENDIFGQPLVNQPGENWEYGVSMDWPAQDAEDNVLTPLRASSKEEASSILHSGGAGLFSTPSDYCQIIAALLNHGTHLKTGHQLLQRETLNEMLKNQIPEHPNFARNLPPAAKPSFINSAPEMYPQPENEAQGWGLSFFKLLSDGPTGRSAGSIWWSGLANLVWWADVERGIGGVFASQILPFGDPEFFACQAAVEAQLYSALSINAGSEK
ncbi:uncharacterized protein LMH87_008397 [Akanthomyces muscarius]|uniref:Beta-lactamase-related domain-containing protein n=1 Tax=Akanthomyces muscarius TaxID=2231603 RepID=A0A9W8QJL7_AKAMU|nr:uncharacterized protein LMH87_008397 [Akanthomyces muscarius]KAJ4159499.1 hypothetical protein LMH87_008397 [Akanthomyces muscarius]